MDRLIALPALVLGLAGAIACLLLSHANAASIATAGMLAALGVAGAVWTARRASAALRAELEAHGLRAVAVGTGDSMSAAMARISAEASSSVMPMSRITSSITVRRSVRSIRTIGAAV